MQVAAGVDSQHTPQAAQCRQNRVDVLRLLGVQSWTFLEDISPLPAWSCMPQLMHACILVGCRAHDR